MQLSPPLYRTLDQVQSRRPFQNSLSKMKTGHLFSARMTCNRQKIGPRKLNLSYIPREEEMWPSGKVLMDIPRRKRVASVCSLPTSFLSWQSTRWGCTGENVHGTSALLALRQLLPLAECLLAQKVGGPLAFSQYLSENSYTHKYEWNRNRSNDPRILRFSHG